MAMRNKANLIGEWAFLVGVLLAVVFPLFQDSLSTAVIWTLLVIGIVVGLLNVTSEESSHFMMSGAVLIIASAFGKDVISEVQLLPNILSSLLLIFVPATIVVEIKNVFTIARN